MKVQKECEQLTFELRRQGRERKFDKGSLKQHFEQEIDRRREKSKLLEYQIEQLDVLPLGSELNDGEVDMIVDVDIGDDWDKIMSEPSVVIKNGKVFEIRQGGH
ncbi:MAG TPA: YlqD family protein [Bacillales bacterium]|nr:YlqD family protein [Bacillales bacterium]